MKYISTRGQAPELGFEDVLLTGLARDGGLYVPQTWPVFQAEDFAALAGVPYADAATAIMRPFIAGEIPDDEFASMVAETYAGFDHPAVTPLVQLRANDWLLELFHGPTLAFKDIAMQLLARLMDRALQRRGARVTIVGATSGDTGGAAIEAFRGREAVDIFMLYPHERISEVQRRQMTTPPDANVHAIALEGTFDDCQNLLKDLFNNLALRDRLNLSGVNSINWARLLPQIVYYVTAAVALGAPSRRISFCVPTGNFGDIFAGHVARRMGLPIDQLVIATNVNDILTRTVSSGRYEAADVVATSSPSMDIQISSNFERIVFELAHRDAWRLRNLMGVLKQTGSFALSSQEHGELSALFSAKRADETEVRKVIAELYAATGYIADPHTAVGLAAAAKVARDPAVPMVTLATAHPAKFPDAVAQAIGTAPPVPAGIADQSEAAERVVVLPNDGATVARYIEERTRVEA